MKALTLWQPWASLMALGAKTVETRGAWAMRLQSLVGQDVAIHAAVRAPRDTPDERNVGEYRLVTVGRTGWAMEGPGLPPVRSSPRSEGYRLPFGAVVAVVRVRAVMPMVPLEHQAQQEDEQYLLDSPEDGGLHVRLSWGEYECIEPERAYGDYQPGRVGIVTGDLRPLAEPVKCRGYQQAWTLPPLVEAMVTLDLSRVAARAAAEAVRA